MDGCGAGGGAGAQELGVRGVGSIARGQWWEQGLRGWRGTHQTQQEGAAADGQALEVSTRRSDIFKPLTAEE